MPSFNPTKEPTFDINNPRLTIDVGVVSIDGPSKANVQTNLTTDFQVRNHFEYDKHIYMAGQTSPNGFPVVGKTASFFQLASPTMLWMCDWTSSRIGAIPRIPNPNPPSANTVWTLLDTHYETPQVTVGVDGTTAVYRVSGTYFYGAAGTTAQPFNMVSFGIPPWLKDEFTRIVQLSDVATDQDLTGITQIKQLIPQIK